MIIYYVIDDACTKWNQSAENAGVAFVKGANERNEFFEKNKQIVMYHDKFGRTR